MPNLPDIQDNLHDELQDLITCMSLSKVNENGQFICLYQVRVIVVFTVLRLLTDFVCLYILMSFDFPFVRLFGVR